MSRTNDVFDFDPIDGGMDVPWVMNKAGTWVDGLDRSSLGRFAVSRDDLLLAAINRVISSNITHNRPSGDNKVGAKAEIANLYSMAMKARTAANVEVAFWSGGNWTPDNGESPSAVDNLRIIAANPIAYHDYFAVDIWNISLIEKFIKDDIDPNLALILYDAETQAARRLRDDKLFDTVFNAKRDISDDDIRYLVERVRELRMMGGGL